MTRKRIDGLICALFITVIVIVTYFYYDSTYSFIGLKSMSRQRNHADTSETNWLFQNPTGLTQNDSTMVNYIRKYHLTPPSTRTYKLAHPNYNPSGFWMDLSPYLNLNGKTGFFIEAGANDGEYHSNTLHLEKNYNWKGLLVEPDPILLAKLRMRNRKAWIADVGFSYTDYPLKIEFYHRLDISRHIQFTQGMGILNNSYANANAKPYPHKSEIHRKDFLFVGYVECFPLFSILSAMNVTEVDYMSLDIQGPELKVLRTIPFDSINIKVITVAYNLVSEGVQTMKEFLESKNYKVVKLLKDVEILAVQKDYFQTLMNDKKT